MAMALILVIGGVIGLSIVWRGGGLAGSETNGRVSIGGPFSLLDQHGERVTEKDFAGRFMLIYFGYTYCPDFCPLSLSAMTEALDLLDPVEADQVTPVFISVDPARDTVEALADYAPHFHPRLVALTGSDDEVKAAAKAYRVYYAIPAKEDDSYAVDHSTFIYLMGPDGAYRAHFSHNTTPEEIADRLRTEQKKP
jgi:protein SCO1/2